MNFSDPKKYLILLLFETNRLIFFSIGFVFGLATLVVPDWSKVTEEMTSR